MVESICVGAIIDGSRPTACIGCPLRRTAEDTAKEVIDAGAPTPVLDFVQTTWYSAHES